jgi:glycolate oxidase iron-sulfur subunit
MKHVIPIESLGSNGELMANAVEKCVHCGFCLPACPTYSVLGEEMDSPRGRIILMKSVLEGSVELNEAVPYIDRCLGCLGCVTACPSGVPYGDLITPFRAYAEQQRRRPIVDRLARRVTREVLPYPERFRLAARAGKLARPTKSVFPSQFQAMLNLLPDNLPDRSPLPESFPAQGERRARVALLAGCVQQALWPEINWATLRVLSKNGVEVLIPPDQGCCGGLGMHTGDHSTARDLAISNMRAFSKEVDAILTNAAGCGSTLREYPLLFTDMTLEADARSFSAKVMDISVFLDQLGIESPPPLPTPIKLTYHDACHLAHAQGVTSPPRALLQLIPNLTLVPLPESDLCCGSAGSYNIEQPEIASKLGARKALNILSTGVDAVATGNIGCLIQLRNHLSASTSKNGGSPHPPSIWHTIEVLDRAYLGQALNKLDRPRTID